MKDLPLPKYSLKLLGRFELSGPQGPIELANKKLAALLAYLACSAPVPQSREKLATLLWGSHFETQARQNLRQALFRLRRALGPDVVVADGDGVSLAAGVLDCDATRLKALIEQGSRASLSEALDLYRDGLLADVATPEEAWIDWVVGERARLEGLTLDALVRLGEIELAAGRLNRTLETAHRVLAINNFREDAHRLIMGALAAAGRKAEALKHYQDLVALLRRELSTEPDAATSSLAAALAGALPPGGASAVAETPAGGGDEPPPAEAVRFSGPERRQLTIVACEMVGSEPLAARLDPEDMRDLIGAFHEAVTGVVSRFDGFVAQHLGDRVLVYFGYPAAHEHDAEQAVRAALAILDAVPGLKSAPGVTLQARIGIATGLVVVGEPLGAGDTGQRIAIGEAPDLAARLQGAVAPGAVVIAAATHRLVGRMFDCRALAAIEVKGLVQPVEAWQVRGEMASVSRFEARRAGALYPLVGRQEEIDLLLRRWDEARRGEGRVVLLSGEPGIGKSRIAESLLARLGGESLEGESLEDEPRARLRYFCSPHHAHSPLYPFIAQLERDADFQPGSPARAKLDRLQALLEPAATDLPRDVALIAELLGLPADERCPALAVSPQQKREMTLTALLDQLEGAAGRGSVLIVFEDVHWIDPTSQDLLDRMVARIGSLPVLLVVTVRPELRPAWIGEPHVTMLPLSRLGRRDSVGIIGGVTRDKALPDAVVEQILAHTDGVPLFIEELTSTLLESGLLREAPDRYVLDGPLPPLAIPTTLQASLVARLDRLASVKDVAQIGAAIGREFSHEVLAAVSALAPSDLDTALERLTASGLIVRRGMPPEATYAFKHALVRDAAYDTMLRSKRRPLHARIAKGLVEQFPALAESQPEVVAHHFTEAGLASEAIGYWRRAGRLAFWRSANREAAGSLEQALHLLETLPESPSTLEQGFEIRLELRQPLIQFGDVRRAQQHLLEAEVLAERMNDDRRRALVCASMTNIHTRFGELDEALQVGMRSLEIARRIGDLRLRIPATTMLEHVHFYRSEHQQVVALASGNLAALPAEWVSEHFGLDAPPSVIDRGYLVMSLAELGLFADVAEPEAEAIRLAGMTQHAFTVGRAHGAAGIAHLLRGDWAGARPRFEQVMRNGGLLRSYAIASSAWILARLGETRQALSEFSEGEQLVQRLEADGYVGRFAWLYLQLGRAALVLGRLGDAQRLGDRALEFSRHQPGYMAHALHLLGDIAAHPERFDAERGESCYRQVLELAEPRGMRPLVAHHHLGLGALYVGAGRRQEGQKHLACAISMYREMDMPFWRGQAEAEKQRLDEGHQ